MTANIICASVSNVGVYVNSNNLSSIPGSELAFNVCCVLLTNPAGIATLEFILGSRTGIPLIAGALIGPEDSIWLDNPTNCDTFVTNCGALLLVSSVTNLCPRLRRSVAPIPLPEHLSL